MKNVTKQQKNTIMHHFIMNIQRFEWEHFRTSTFLADLGKKNITLKKCGELMLAYELTGAKKKDLEQMSKIHGVSSDAIYSVLFSAMTMLEAKSRKN